ncbi:hypothetical protein L198_00259 [Cryptococcus wingfieldii CBS 7118]|uniref:Derlin n=1 Tax=Cryptococcus wingfieldii CBS 7118 TaxID=1295528 RepID=A0A1E3K615_9TREE|nr:hypothetical protein L198_00259 [Cryptococcus wingfieldii CBS 7118]ODO08529.1 hypothetical protein L198_00259 [Cryptococcus wingfieldii CBS 7118]
MADLAAAFHAVPPVTRTLLLALAAVTAQVLFPAPLSLFWGPVARRFELFNIPIGLPFLFRPLLLAQTYVWCRVNPTVRVSIFGLFTLPTSLYPPALILLDLLTGGPAKALGGIVGLLAGHLWWFLSTYLPSHAPSHLRRANPLATPLFFKRQFPASQPMPQTVTGTGSGYTQATGHSTARSEASQAARHRWGGGQRLGGSAL